MAIQRLKVDQSIAGDGLGMNSKGVMNVNVGSEFDIENDILNMKLADSTLVVGSNGIGINPVIINNLSTEISTRISNDIIFNDNLSTEVSLRISESTAVSTSLSSLTSTDTLEASIRLSADTDLINNLSTEVSIRTSQSTTTSTNLSTEVSQMMSTDTLEASIRLSADTILTNNLSTEASNRILGDNNNSTAISTEISTRTSQSTTTSTGLSSEASSRILGDTTLTNNLSSEVSLRNSQSTTISTTISSLTSTDTLEASIRLSADTVLTNNLSTEISTRVLQSTTTSTNISTEVSNRISTDMVISTALSVEISIPSINGCKLQWVNTTTLNSTVGSINISGINYIINSPISIGWSNLYSDSTKTANTWYYVYLKNVANVLTPYISITTPTKDVFGNTITADMPCAKYHPTLLGRFIGSFKTDVSSNIIQFDISGNYVAFVGLGSNYLLSSGSATSKTLINCRTTVPYTSSLVRVYYELVSGTGSRYIADATVNYLTTKYGAGTIVMPITNNGIYYYVSASNNPVSIGIHGYFEDT